MRPFLLCLSLAIGFCQFSNSNAVSNDALKPMAPWIAGLKASTQHPSGTAIAVVKNGKIIHEEYFGFADIENKVAVDQNTVFYIASATKPFFALNALLLEEQQKLNSNASLKTLFPTTQFAGFSADSVRIKDLLTHTSGVENAGLVWATALSGIHDSKSRYQLIGMTQADRETAHGSFNYGNVGYNILSVWQDRALREPWQKQLDRRIFQPLGMTQTSAYISVAKAKGWTLAKPYSVQNAQRNVALYLEKADATMQAAGGIISTAPDIARFLIAQLSDGKLNAQQVLPRSVIARSQTKQTATDGASFEDFKRAGYAWGWYIGDYKGRRMLHHFGGFAGFHAHLSFIPEADIGLVVLNNEDFLATKMTNLIADYVYGVLLQEADNNSRVAARFEALNARAGGLEVAVANQRKTLQDRKWQLSLPLKKYAGRYGNPLLGEIRITEQNQALSMDWGRLKSAITPYEELDIGRVELQPNSGQAIKFVVSKGKIEALKIDQMEFTRK